MEGKVGDGPVQQNGGGHLHAGLVAGAGHDGHQAEGDLMELNGWSSPQMLRRYGASARSARARRSYDRVMTGIL
jgi:hypothetical protein